MTKLAVTLYATIILVVLCSVGRADNLLPNSSFEQGTQAREIYPLIGEYRHHGSGQWQIDTTQSFHGKQSLRMTGTRPFFWQVVNKDSLLNSLSAYMKASQVDAPVRLGFEMLGFGDDGGVRVECRMTQDVKVGTDWARFEMPIQVKRTPKDNWVIGKHLFRVWIAPLTDAPVWVDAVQLERGRLESSPYTPERGYNELDHKLVPLLQKPLVTPEQDPIAPPQEQTQKGLVGFVVAETEGVARTSAPVSGGIVFPPAELFDETTVRVVDADGRAVESQTRVLARRKDGSIVSLLVDLQTPLRAHEKKAFVLHYGSAKQDSAGGIATDTAEAIVLDTGTLRATIRKDGFRWFDSISSAAGTVQAVADQAGCFSRDLDGTLYSSAWGVPEEIVIESNGPLHAVVHVRGKHVTRDGAKAFLEYEARIHAYKGQPHFLLEMTFLNREPVWATPVHSVFSRLPVRAGGGPSADVFLQNGAKASVELSETGAISITQVHDYYGFGAYALLYDKDGAESQVQENIRASGIFRARGALVAVQDFWQLNPKQLEIGPQGIAVYHWPDRHVSFPDVPFGLADTLHVVYEPFAEQDEQAVSAAAAPLLQVDPEWVARSGVFGDYMTGSEGEKDYPQFEDLLERQFRFLALDTEIEDITGAIDYGDFGGPGGWMNNETSAARNLLLQYLRTYDPAVFRRAWAMVRHLREVDICHISPGTKFMHHPTAGMHTMFGFHTGHYWTTGLVWHYLLTGDQRTYEIARDVGAMAIDRAEKPFTGRERSRLLMHAAELYELTHLKVLRQAFETQYNHGKGSLDESDYYTGLALNALVKLYEATGEQKYLDRFQQECKQYLVEYGGSEKAKRDVGQGRSWELFSALAKAAVLSGDQNYITQFQGRFIRYLASVHGFDHNAVLGAEFLRAAQRLDVRDIPPIPRPMLAISLLIGGADKTFPIAVLDPDDSPMEFAVYNTRGFRVSNKKNSQDRLAFALKAPNGQTLASGDLPGAQAEIRRLEVPADGQSGKYVFELSCYDDGQGAFSSSNPRVALPADRKYRFRATTVTGFARFAILTAPDSDSVVVRTEWDRPGSISGKVEGVNTGVALEDLHGKIVSSGRWASSMGLALNENGKDTSNPEQIVLPVPPEHRGKILWLTLTPGRKMNWQITNLGLPYLAEDPEALRILQESHATTVADPEPAETAAP